MDANRNIQTSRPVRRLGTNGVPSLPQPQLQSPELPQIQDITPQLTQRTQQLVDQGYQYQVDTMETAARLGTAEAQRLSRSGTASAFGGIASAIGAGIELYTELERRKAERAQQQASEQAELQKQLDEQTQAAIGMEIEKAYSDMLGAVANGVSQEGAISTYRSLVDQIVSNSGLPQNLQLELIRAGYNYIHEAQRTYGTRALNEQQQLRDNQIDTRVIQLQTVLSQELVGLNATGVDATEILNRTDQIIGEFIQANNLSPLEASIVIKAGVAEQAEALQQFGIATAETQRINQLTSQYADRLVDIWNQTRGNTAARNLAIAQLQQESDANGLSIQWGNVFPTDNELLQEQADYNRLSQELFNNDPAVRNHPVVQDWENANAWRMAASWIANPSQQASIEQARQSGTPLENAAIQIYDTFKTDMEDYRAGQLRLTEIEAEVAELRVDWEEATRQFAPSVTLGPETIPDLRSGRWTRIGERRDRDGNLIGERGTISREEWEATGRALNARIRELDSERQDIQQETFQLLDRYANAPGNFSFFGGVTPAYIERLDNYINQLRPEYEGVIQNPPGRTPPGGNIPNFNYGAAVTAPPVAALANENGVVFPIQADWAGAYRFTSYYKEWRGNRYHWGIDIAPNNPSQRMGVRSIAGGTVLHSSTGWNGAFGNLVTVRTPDGHVEQYNHLDEIHVSVGEVIAPGESVGTIGNTGRTTGPHLDFMVYKPGTPDEAVLAGSQSYERWTINPLDYMRLRGQQQVQANTGSGLPPNQSAPGTYSPFEPSNQVSRSAYGSTATDTNVVYRGSSANSIRSENSANVRQPNVLSATINPYRSGLVQNDGEANFGYAALREDRELRIAVHQTASRLGIPAVWLADLIDYETAGTWRHDIENGEGCVGLQFCPGGELNQLAQDWGVGQYEARNRLKQISLVGQLRYLENYFKRYANGGRDLVSIRHLYAGWNGGPSRIRNPDSLPPDSNAARSRQRPIDFHIEKLGGRAGRRYERTTSSRGADYGHTHTTYHRHCPLCNEQMQRFGTVAAHISEIA